MILSIDIYIFQLIELSISNNTYGYIGQLVQGTKPFHQCLFHKCIHYIVLTFWEKNDVYLLPLITNCISYRKCFKDWNLLNKILDSPVICSCHVIFLYGQVYVTCPPLFELRFGQSTSIPSQGSGGGSLQERSNSEY